MNFEDFNKQLLPLAQDEDIPLRSVQAIITSFFKNKLMPFLQSNQSFVVRCSINNLGEVFRNVTRCSYPPDSIKDRIKIQRANYPQQQVFYCSMPTDSELATASLTCIMETAWEHIEDLNITRTYVTLSRWSLTRPLQLWVLPFSEKSCQKNKDFYKIRENMKWEISQYSNSAELLQGLQFISSAFSAKENKIVNYRITAAFYNALLFYERIFGIERDGLLYPSANTDGAGLNLVLKKELVDNGILYCDYVMMNSLQRLPNDPKRFHIMPASNFEIPNSDGKIKFSSIW